MYQLVYNYKLNLTTHWTKNKGIPKSENKKLPVGKSLLGRPDREIRLWAEAGWLLPLARFQCSLSNLSPGHGEGQDEGEAEEGEEVDGFGDDDDFLDSYDDMDFDENWN